MDKVGEITAIIQDHVQRLAVGEDDCLLDTPHILFIGLTLPGVDWDTTGSNSSSSMVLLTRQMDMLTINTIMLYTCVEKMLQDDQVTSAPSSSRVSMRTAVWIVM